MYWAKFFLDTTSFDAERTGAYAALLGHCWVRGGSLPDDDEQLARFARCSPARWRKHRDVLGQEPYFRIADGRWTQKRLTAEHAAALLRYQSKVDNGAKGGRPRKNPSDKPTESEPKPAGFYSPKRTETHTQTHTHTQDTKDKGKSKSVARKRATPIPPDFGISDRVVNWAADKGYNRLPEYLEAFIGRARAKGYTYVDWDDAFMNSIRDDWGNIRVVKANGGHAPTRAERRAANMDDLCGRTRNERTIDAGAVDRSPVRPALGDIREPDNNDVGGLPKGGHH